MSGKLLLVDDDRHVLESMTDWLRDQGLEVDASPGYADALGQMERRRYDVLLADIRLQDGDGFDLLEQSRRRWPATQVVLLTGYGTADSAVDAIRAGAFDYLTKPLIDDELLMSIERALGQRRVIEENESLKEELDRKHGMGHIVGGDPRMLRVFD
ncbi:MAG: response regulator, partial [Planctomycetota bacterium]